MKKNQITKIKPKLSTLKTNFQMELNWICTRLELNWSILKFELQRKSRVSGLRSVATNTRMDYEIDGEQWDENRNRSKRPDNSVQPWYHVWNHKLYLAIQTICWDLSQETLNGTPHFISYHQWTMILLQQQMMTFRQSMIFWNGTFSRGFTLLNLTRGWNHSAVPSSHTVNSSVPIYLSWVVFWDFKELGASIWPLEADHELYCWSAVKYRFTGPIGEGIKARQIEGLSGVQFSHVVCLRERIYSQ